MESEYIIVYDENGEPHLEHAWLRRGQAHKYIMKIGEGLKARYFYTQAEVDAYMNRGKQKAQNVADKTKKSINDLTGATAKKQLEKAKYNDRLAKLATKKAESAVDRARQNKDPNTGRLNIEAIKAEVHDNNTERQVRYSQKKYDKTPMGIAEKTASNVKSTAQRLNENTKSKMDKMREEFRKGADSVKDTASKAASEVKAKSFDKKAEKLQNKADDLNKKAFNDTSKQKDAAQAQIDANNAKIKSLEEDAKASEHKTNKAAIDKLKAQNDDLKDVANGNEIREQSVAENEIKEEKVRDSALKSKYGEYTKGDPDFDDKNFDEKNRAGDSDFFIASRPDGSSVILEEDMKWVLPKGVNPRDPAIVSALNKDFKAGSNEEWVKQVTEAIDEAVEKERSKRSGIENSERSKRIDTMLDSLGNTTVSNFTRANINAYRQMYQEGKISESEYKRIMKNFEEELNKYSNENRR